MDHKSFALKMAQEAGDIIEKYFYTEHGRRRKKDTSPVTIADTTINQRVVDAVKKQFPDHGYIGEEGGSFNETKEYVWVCDPVDGTIPFTYGIPTVAFSLALVRDGKPVLAVIHNPLSKRLYYAEEGRGAFLNDTPIHVSKKDSLERGLFGICIWNNADYPLFKTAKTLLLKGVDFQTGSTAYLGALVASGEAVANLFPHSNPWDFAAVKIIVEEAGGTVTDLFGEDQRYDQRTKGGLATNGLVHSEIIDILNTELASK